jgi:hypothetical protein
VLSRLAIGFSLLASLAVPYALEVNFSDVAPAAGLRVPNTYGGRTTKKYILETTGNGAAIFDYDGDGLKEILITNGTTLDGNPRGAHPQLYRNDGKGHFTDVSEQAGLTHEGWGQGVCVGDYDNDGHPDLFLTYYGHNVLYRNLGNGRFADVTKAAGLPVDGTRWGTGCTFLDYDRDGKLDIFVSNYVDLDLAKTPRPGEAPTCFWKGAPVMCGPQGLPLAHNALYHNNGDGTFTDVSEKAGILKPGGRYGLGVVAADFDNDGWPDIYVACDMTPSLLYHNRRDGTFEECGVEAGVDYKFNGALQDGAFEILAHALRMTTWQQQCAEVGVVHMRVIQRLAKCGIFHKFAIRPARIAIRAQRQANELELAQCRNSAPEVQSDSRQHDRIGVGHAAVRRRKDEVVAGVGENSPADRGLGRIEVRARQRHQYVHAGGGPSRKRRCAHATSCHAPNL